MEEATKWIPITINSWDISFNSIRYAISKNETIMEYLKNNCRDPEWNPITNINQISDNIIAHFILNNKINHKVLTQAFSWEKALKLYFNINNEEQILSDKYNEWFVFKWENFCEFIFNAQNQLPNSRLSKILKNIIWKDSINKDDITAWIIRQIIRKPDWSIRENINDLKANEGFIIVYPLNKKSNNSRNGPIFNTEKGRDEGLLLDGRYEEMYNKKLETEKATKKGINKTLSEKSNTRTWNKEGRDIQDPKKKTPTPKNPITPKKHIPQKK